MAPDGVATRKGDAVVVSQGRPTRNGRNGFLTKLGRKSWPFLHSLSDRWPCRRCRPTFSAWMSGVHDAVNVRIGRPPFRPETWARFRNGELDGRYHRGCVMCRAARIGVRWFARAP